MTYSAAEAYLSQRDPVMATIIADNYPLHPRASRGDDYFSSLVRTIVGQQVSTHSAAATFARFQEVSQLDPTLVLQLPDEQLRAAGLSRQKIRYIRELARHFVQQPDIFMHLESLSDEAVVQQLTKILGIGVWSAQMFLLFTLTRADVFAPGDRGLQLAIDRHYPVEQPRTPAEYAIVAERWQPHRSTASRYLWESLNNTPRGE